MLPTELVSMAGQRCILIVSAFLGILVDDASSVVIQALIDLDNDSEDLLTSLISKVDAIIDPKVIDSKNATQELAFALLKLGPLITVNGTISDGTHGYSLSFSFNAKAAVNETETQAIVRESDDISLEELRKGRGGILKPVVDFLEPYLVGAATVVFNGIMSNIIANFMNEASLLSNTNAC